MWGLLADPDRRRVFAAVCLGSDTSAAVGAVTGLPPRGVVEALHRLEQAGAVRRSGERWEVDDDELSARARVESPPAPSASGVLSRFLRDGRLLSIPATRAKRLVVLDSLAGSFEPGVRYPEREVDALLKTFHPDHAALRRHLVDEGFLDRADGVYWRSGGSTPV